MTSDAEEDQPMTALAEPDVLIQRISAHVPVGYLTAADLPYIDLEDVGFEIQDGAISLMPPPSFWHDRTSDKIRHHLDDRYACVAEDVDVVLGPNLRRPDVLGLSASEDEILASEVTTLTPDVIELVVEVISHDPMRSRDQIAVRRDRVTKYQEYAAAGIPEYWIVDEVPGDRSDASIEMYRLEDGAYRPIRVVLLSELLKEADTP